MALKVSRSICFCYFQALLICPHISSELSGMDGSYLPFSREFSGTRAITSASTKQQGVHALTSALSAPQPNSACGAFLYLVGIRHLLIFYPLYRTLAETAQ